MKTTLGIEDLLELSLFRGESPGTVEWLLDIAEERLLEEGEVLLRPDISNSTLYIIIDGSLRIELKVEGRPVITHVGAGECVGELSVLDGLATAAYVVADRRTRLMLIERDTLWRLIYTSHVVAKNLFYLLSGRVRRDDEALSKSLELQQMSALRARTDALTGLYNRFWLDEVLPRLIERAERGRELMGLMLMDADHFKAYNDNYGHLAGDEALRLLGTTLMAHIRPNDSAVRYGGEEFMVVLPGLDSDELVEAAERVRIAIRDARAAGRNGEPLPPLTVSLGVAVYRPGMDVRALIAEADQALYRAKAGGRDRVAAAWEEE